MLQAMCELLGIGKLMRNCDRQHTIGSVDADGVYDVAVMLTIGVMVYKDVLGKLM